MFFLTFITGMVIYFYDKFKTMCFNTMCESQVRMDEKVVVVTGGNSGIGKETARNLYWRGARVILACRDLKKADEAAEDIKKTPPSKSNREEFRGGVGELVIYKLDLCDFECVRECSEKLINSEKQIHILINNAGGYFPFQKTKDGYEYHFQTNYLGHFLLTLMLLPKIKASAPGCRIINVSSLVHYGGKINFDDLNLEKSFGPMKAYAQSKLANILFTKELARKFKDNGISGITTYSLHPGVVSTEAFRNLDQTLFPGARSIVSAVGKLVFKSSEQGAQTTIHCAVDECIGHETGLYYRECTSTIPSRLAQDEETAKKLWDISLKIVSKDQEDFMEFFTKRSDLQ